jgi:hypothetical protein
VSRKKARSIALIPGLISNCDMPRLTIRTEAGQSISRPADFANASPFQTRKTKKDPPRTAVFAAVAVAVLAFFASMIALALMKAPGF